MAQKKVPPLPDKAPGKNGFKYREQFGVIIICRDEAHHRDVYQKIAAQGYKCRAVRT